MENLIKKQVEIELKTFTSRNFERPSDCRNLEQIRYYIQELCGKIENLEERFHYVPHSAYSLLAEYNARQNAIIHVDFKKNYRVS